MEHPMLSFLSEANLRTHMERSEQMRLRKSVLIKETPSLAGKNWFSAAKMRLSPEVRRDVDEVFGWTDAHRIFFSSFESRMTGSDAVRRQFGSEASFLWICENLAQTAKTGFLWVTSERGRILPRIAETPPPGSCLCVDLWEHAYFTDYGFDRASYVKAAVTHWNLQKITDFQIGKET